MLNNPYHNIASLDFSLSSTIIEPDILGLVMTWRVFIFKLWACSQVSIKVHVNLGANISLLHPKLQVMLTIHFIWVSFIIRGFAYFIILAIFALGLPNFVTNYLQVTCVLRNSIHSTIWQVALNANGFNRIIYAHVCN